MEKKKPIVSVTYENEMCVTSLLCGPWADLWPFMGFYVTAINRPVDHTGET